MPETRILYVDDDENDRFMMEKASGELALANQIVCVASANEAIRYLIGEDPYVDRERYPFPTLIITDIKMENGSGFDLLEFLANNPAWSIVPRVVYSGSSDQDDVKKAFLLGCSAYHTKSIGEGSAAKRLKAILTYWKLSETPPVDASGRLLITASLGKLGERFAQPHGGKVMERVEHETFETRGGGTGREAGERERR